MRCKLVNDTSIYAIFQPRFHKYIVKHKPLSSNITPAHTSPRRRYNMSDVPESISQPVPMLDFSRQFNLIREPVLAAIEEVCSSQRFILGPQVTSFEAAAATACDVPHAIGCASGTDALWLAMAAAGIGPGDSVITTPFQLLRLRQRHPPLRSPPDPRRHRPRHLQPLRLRRRDRPPHSHRPTHQSHPARPPLRPVRRLGRLRRPSAAATNSSSSKTQPRPSEPPGTKSPPEPSATPRPSASTPQKISAPSETPASSPPAPPPSTTTPAPSEPTA